MSLAPRPPQPLNFAKMFLDHVIRLHGIPDSIVSDRGAIFTSQFWTALSKFLNLKSRLSTAFHPQTDGQTERMNQTVEQYLRIYCNYHQDNWSQLLSLAEFSYNNAQHVSIGCSPFYANYGYNPRFSIELRQFAKHPVPAAQEMAERLKNIHEDLTELIKVTQNQQAKYYDAKHKRVEYKVGDKVWLLSSNIRTQRPSKKLDWKRLGPYPIIRKDWYSSVSIAASFILENTSCLPRFSPGSVHRIRYPWALSTATTSCRCRRSTRI